MNLQISRARTIRFAAIAPFLCSGTQAIAGAMVLPVAMVLPGALVRPMAPGLAVAMVLAVIISLSTTSAPEAHAAQIVSGQAGKVANVAMTTRQVAMHSLVENALGRENQVALDLAQTKSREFIRETTAALVESAVFLEAQAFSAALIKPDELQIARKKVLAKLRTNRNWKSLEVSETELTQLLERKLRAKKFIQFKVDSSAIPISDKELRDYYESNRVRFDDQPFEKHKDNIRAYLNRAQVDRRVKDWFDLLHAKYKIRNFLSRE